MIIILYILYIKGCLVSVLFQKICLASWSLAHLCLFLHDGEFRKRSVSSVCLLLPGTSVLCVLALWSDLVAAAPSVTLQVVYTVLYWCNYAILLCGVWLSTEIQLLIFATTFSSGSLQ